MKKNRSNILQYYNERKQTLHYSYPYFDATVHKIQNIMSAFSISMLHGQERIDHLYFNAKQFWKFPKLKNSQFKNTT